MSDESERLKEIERRFAAGDMTTTTEDACCLRDQIAGLTKRLEEAELAHRRYMDAEPANPTGPESWRCFHCGFETANPLEAEAHFGEREDAEELPPTCTLWSKLCAEDRAQEFQDLRQQLNEEQNESGRLNMKVEGLEYRVEGIASEIASRFKNCRTIDEAWHKYDSMEGRALLAEEQLADSRAREKKLADALNSLGNESSGFLTNATVENHGFTNMRVLAMRIEESRTALAEYRKALPVEEKTK